MENLEKIETRLDPALETRPLTPQELSKFAKDAEMLDINFHNLGDDPSIEIIKTETRDGMPMEIEIKKDGIPVFYDNLNFWRKIKIRKQEPKTTIH